MSYYEQKIAALEARIAELTQNERMKAIPVEAQLMVRIGELNDENARLKAEVEQSKRINTELLVLSERQASDIRRLTKAGDGMLSEWSSGDETDAKNFRKALVIWHAAKQGGQLP